MAQLNFKWGLYGNLPATTADTVGTVYVTTDEQAMYVDVAANKRIRISQIVTYADYAAFEAALAERQPPYDPSGSFYYIAAENALLKWVSNEGTTAVPGAGDDNKITGTWKQINSTHELQAAVDAIEAALGERYTKADRTNTVAGDIEALEDRVQSLINVGGQVNVVEGALANGVEVPVDTDKNLVLGALAVKNTVAAADIDANAVTEEKIFDGAVTTAKIADANVTTAKIADGNVTLAKLDSDTQTKIGKITDMETSLGNKIEGVKKNGTALSIDADKHAVLTLGALADKDTVATADIDDNAVTTAKIADGNITEAKLAADSVTTDKIKDGNVTLAKLDSSVQTEIGKIAGIESAIGSEGLQKDIADVSARVKAIEDDYLVEQDLTDAVAELNQTIADGDKAVKDIIGGEYTSTNTVHAAIDTLGQTVKDHGTRLGTAEGDIEAIEGIVGAGLADKTTLTKAIEDLQALVDEDTGALREDIDDLTAIVGDGFIGEDGQVSETLTAAITKNRTDIGSLGETVGQLKDDIGNLSNVMNFRGAFAAAPDADGVETFANVTLDPAAVDGDVIIVGAKEYVRSGNAWVEFGDASGNAAAISALEGRVTDNEADILALQGSVGDASSGLVKDVADIKAEQTTQNNTLTQHTNDIQAINDRLTWVSFDPVN